MVRNKNLQKYGIELEKGKSYNKITKVEVIDLKKSM